MNKESQATSWDIWLQGRIRRYHSTLHVCAAGSTVLKVEASYNRAMLGVLSKSSILCITYSVTEGCTLDLSERRGPSQGDAQGIPSCCSSVSGVFPTASLRDTWKERGQEMVQDARLAFRTWFASVVADNEGSIRLSACSWRSGFAVPPKRQQCTCRTKTEAYGAAHRVPACPAYGGGQSQDPRLPLVAGVCHDAPVGQNEGQKVDTLYGKLSRNKQGQTAPSAPPALSRREVQRSDQN